MCARSDSGKSTFICVSPAYRCRTSLARDVMQMLHSICPRTVPNGTPVYTKLLYEISFSMRSIEVRWFGHAWSTSDNEVMYTVERQTSQVTVWSKVSVAADRSRDTKKHAPVLNNRQRYRSWGYRVVGLYCGRLIIILIIKIL